MSAATPAFVIVLAIECVALFFGQRRLFWYTADATGSQMAAYVLAAPGTILHEAAHFIACLLLGVPAGRKVRGPDGRPAKVDFFRPRPGEDGSITLGSVPHARTDPLRGALIAVAPLLLVPPLLVAAAVGLFGSEVLSDPMRQVEQAAIWKTVLFMYVALSAGQGAFPSPGDHIGVVGGLLLGLVGVLLLLALSPQDLEELLRAVCLLLALPAACAGFCLGLFGWMRNNRARSRR